MSTPNLDAAHREIAYLKASHELLERVWNHFGPYHEVWGYKYGADKTRLDIDLQYHFGFDDSE
jgi:hypothetical protein